MCFLFRAKLHCLEHLITLPLLNIKGHINEEYIGFSKENIWECKCNSKEEARAREKR